MQFQFLERALNPRVPRFAEANPEAQGQRVSLDQTIRAHNRAFQSATHKFGYDDAELKDGAGRYVNYDGDTLRAKAAFGSKVKRLRELKEKYDPGNGFDKM
ncbi:hypothetical protein G7Z17_g12001 [Cylindrodendrum hubeiense]|uniref:Berberine/berberine-like domain-containing protein n=1 Tax=Cylindrodendrum hubeiense TaxID=595255 RepID=A0A9P5GWE5_9HYPO|nr:hypothetical protein G7Z17_g12001 [Cylindrodendrum hubeiense]